MGVFLPPFLPIADFAYRYLLAVTTASNSAPVGRSPRNRGGIKFLCNFFLGSPASTRWRMAGRAWGAPPELFNFGCLAGEHGWRAYESQIFQQASEVRNQIWTRSSKRLLLGAFCPKSSPYGGPSSSVFVRMSSPRFCLEYGRENFLEWMTNDVM